MVLTSKAITLTEGEYIDRFMNAFSKPDLTFIFEIGDVVWMNGLLHFITGYGIYNNQMWTERIYEDGCHIGAGNYTSIERAVKIEDESVINHVREEYRKAILDNWQRFLTNYYSLAEIEAHLESVMCAQYLVAI